MSGFELVEDSMRHGIEAEIHNYSVFDKLNEKPVIRFIISESKKGYDKGTVYFSITSMISGYEKNDKLVKYVKEFMNHKGVNNIHKNTGIKSIFIGKLTHEGETPNGKYIKYTPTRSNNSLLNVGSYYLREPVKVTRGYNRHTQTMTRGKKRNLNSLNGFNNTNENFREALSSFHSPRENNSELNLSQGEMNALFSNLSNSPRTRQKRGNTRKRKSARSNGRGNHPPSNLPAEIYGEHMLNGNLFNFKN